MPIQHRELAEFYRDNDDLAKAAEYYEKAIRYGVDEVAAGRLGLAIVMAREFLRITIAPRTLYLRPNLETALHIQNSGT